MLQMPINQRSREMRQADLPLGKIDPKGADIAIKVVGDSHLGAVSPNKRPTIRRNSLNLLFIRLGYAPITQTVIARIRRWFQGALSVEFWRERGVNIVGLRPSHTQDLLGEPAESLRPTHIQPFLLCSRGHHAW